MGQYNIDIVGC